MSSSSIVINLSDITEQPSTLSFFTDTKLRVEWIVKKKQSIEIRSGSNTIIKKEFTNSFIFEFQSSGNFYYKVGQLGSGNIQINFNLQSSQDYIEFFDQEQQESYYQTSPDPLKKQNKQFSEESKCKTIQKKKHQVSRKKIQFLSKTQNFKSNNGNYSVKSVIEGSDKMSDIETILSQDEFQEEYHSVFNSTCKKKKKKQKHRQFTNADTSINYSTPLFTETSNLTTTTDTNHTQTFQNNFFFNGLKKRRASTEFQNKHEQLDDNQIETQSLREKKRNNQLEKVSDRSDSFYDDEEQEESNRYLNDIQSIEPISSNNNINNVINNNDTISCLE